MDQPPPVPPRITERIQPQDQRVSLRRKISLPSFSSSSSSQLAYSSSTANPPQPPVPKLPSVFNSFHRSPATATTAPASSKVTTISSAPRPSTSSESSYSYSPVASAMDQYRPHPTTTQFEQPPSASSSSSSQHHPLSHLTQSRHHISSSQSSSSLNFFRRNNNSHANLTRPSSASNSAQNNPRHHSPTSSVQLGTGPAHHHSIAHRPSHSPTARSRLRTESTSSGPPNSSPTGPLRPLPPPPQSTSSSSPTTSTSTSTVHPQHPMSSAPPGHPPRSSALSSGISYISVLYDHDQPLGAHSIPTRISTRPIHFTSPDHNSLPQPNEPPLQPTPPAQVPPVLPPHSLPVQASSPSTTFTRSSDRTDAQMLTPEQDTFVSGSMSINSIVSGHLGLPSDQGSNSPSLTVYTTRPSIDSARGPSVHSPPLSDDPLPAHHNRSNSFSETRNGASSLRAGLSPSLSVERRGIGTGSLLSSTRQRRQPGDPAGSSRASQVIIPAGFSLAYLSHVARFLKNNVPRGTKIKGNIEYPMSFTGREAVTTITQCLNRINPSTRSTTQATLNRKLALTLSKRLLAERFFHEVTNTNPELNDNIDEVYIFPSNRSCRNNSHLGLDEHFLHMETPRIESDSVEDLPRGILTSLASCYSFACVMNAKGGGDLEKFGVCYSHDCPNRKNRDSTLKRSSSAAAAPETSAAVPPLVQTKDWASVVSKDLLSSLGSKEVARQSIIYEVISGEQEYVQDLDEYESLFITPLKQSNPAILSPARLSEILTKVVSNVLEVRDHNRVLLQNLLIRQQDQHPLVQGVGDLVLHSALQWGEDYIRYTSDQVFGEVEVNEEKNRNPMFAQLLNSIPKTSTRRADFKHYHSRAFVRLQRYLLLLDSLLKKTPDGHPDRLSIENAMDVIRRQCLDADQAVNVQQAKLQLVRLNNDIVIKSPPDLQLLAPSRQLILSGKMLRKPEGGTGLSEWSEVHVMLFDHYFLITKAKRIDENSTKYHMNRPPIMLELIRVIGFNEPCERKSRLIITRTLGATSGLERGNSDPYSNPSSQAGGSLNGIGSSGSNTSQDDRFYPITVHSLGRNNYSVTMYVDSEKARQLWKSKFEEAIGARMQILENYKVFELWPMTDQTFAAPGGVSSSSNGPLPNGTGTPPLATHNSSGSHTVGEALTNMHGAPTCSVPFRSPDGKRLVAIGCMDGLWIGLRNDPSSLKQVIHIKAITQCSVLQDFGYLLVLAEKVLLAYPLESLVPSRNQAAGSNHSISPKGPAAGGGAIASRLSGNKDVLFFKCGKVGRRTLVIYVKKGGVNQTVFKALEPVRNVERSKPVTNRGFFGLGGQRSESFRGYKEFFVPSESYAIQYLRSTLAIHCARGFEIMNLDTLKTASIPDFNQIKLHDARLMALQRRCDECRPLGMFRLGDNEFLLCYDEFAFFADKHGDPIIEKYDGIMEWDGKPNSIAYYAPYVVCFSPTMMEVWNTNESRRVQIVIGQMIACTYDGASGSDESTIEISQHGTTEEDGDRRIHFVMKDLDQFFRVFELVPIKRKF